MSALGLTTGWWQFDLPTVPQPEAVPHPVILLGPSSKVGLAGPEGVAVITVMVDCIDKPEPDRELDEADIVMVVLEITMIDDTEDKMLDKELDVAPEEGRKRDEDDDEVLGEDGAEDEDELLDEEDELELEELLLRVGAIELEEIEEELLLLEVDESDGDVDDGCV